MPLDLTSPADSDLISLGAGEIRALKSDMQDFLSDHTARRPRLIWVSVTQVDIENNTATANETSLPFPDGETISVTEDTSSTNKYRRFDITSTASFTSGTEDSGLRSGIAEAANTWYAIYAVKSQIDSTKFILAGDTTFPTAANVSTLNSRYGTNSWIFIGYIRNGSGVTSHSDILNFVQCGEKFNFLNTIAAADTSVNVVALRGLILANTAGATSLGWTYSAGSGTTQVPDTIATIDWLTQRTAHNSYDLISNQAGTRYYERRVNSNNNGDIITLTMPASEGILLGTGVGASEAFDAIMTGWTDYALGRN